MSEKDTTITNDTNGLTPDLFTPLRTLVPRPLVSLLYLVWELTRQRYLIFVKSCNCTKWKEREGRERGERGERERRERGERGYNFTNDKFSNTSGVTKGRVEYRYSKFLCSS